MKKKNERHIAILLAVMMIFMNFIIAPVMAEGEDARTKVMEIEATATNMQPVFGNPVSSEPTFTVTKGTEAHFNTIMGDWQKKNVETGKFEVGDGTITAGTWRYEAHIRVDGVYGTTHVLDKNFTVKVNGEIWRTEMGVVGTNFSFGTAYSPEFTVEEPAIGLTFFDSSTFDITTVYKNVAISSFSVANNAAGGKKPYTFSRTSGPAWINVSTDGIISGTPTAMGENEDLVVRVTDSNSNYKEITISVANTIVNPEDRIKVTEIEATATNMQPVFGNSVSSEPTFTVTKGTEAHFNTIMGDWQKKNVETGKFEVGDGTITAGTWRYEAHIRVDGVYGTTHVLDKNFTVKVNGEIWRTEMGVVGTNFSFGTAYSPEFTVEDSTHTDHSARTKNDGQPATCEADGWKDYYKCNGCDKVFDAATNGNEITDLAAWKTGAGKIEKLGHDYSVMQHDDTQHWKKCSRCDSTTTKEDHSGGNATCTAKAVCSVCGTEYGDLAEHSYGTDWKYDTNNHWKECTCGDKKDSAEHTWNVTAATEETDKHCTICGYVAEPKLGHTHSLTLVPEVKPDCDTDGTKAYYTCTCGKYFEDATATKEITDLEAWKTGAGKIEKLCHDIKINTPANGKVELSKTKAKKDDIITVTATANPGYELDSIMVDGTAITGNTFTMPDKEVSVVVKFKATGTTPPTPPTPTPTPTPEPYYPGYDDWYEPYRPHRPYRPSKPVEEKKTEEKPIDKPAKKVETEVILTIGSNNLDNKINGVDSFKGMDVAPYIKNGRTMLPIRYVAEALGMSVSWDAKTRTVIIQDMFYTVEIPVDTNKIIVNGDVFTSDVKPEIVHGRTMMPIANIARALGLKDGKDIIWDASMRQVIIKRIYDR